ncbi:leucyl-tRNA synthetase [Burkholderia lata]|uniref:Leucine--tRNA ligase n=1 Tax=Burkholderia lata (strain ATCC 17760 / DSM 23089 / LMG 22485 / NCIMB 9086 / R18194 / 383) TaxID=482957 RepID=A0A6P2NW90_BURL3|nr:leucine--tRNA ligase [Burkholderia lata]VWB99114.1 leucyl-tRNA synthetase [Burkholderia lata]
MNSSLKAFDFRSIEPKWTNWWDVNRTFVSTEDCAKQKFYCLDMFPYPSGAGLHVGHPLGYIATDIVSRYKRLCGYNVLHAMGFDSFGLPAEQYAIETGQHPATTTAQNIATFKSQLRKLGLSLDLSREIQTSSPDYYRWTQWIFIRLFQSWYDKRSAAARPIGELIAHFDAHGTQGLDAHTDTDATFSREAWAGYDDAAREDVLMRYRLAYLSDATVNWCPALGTVLANDEVINGLSERGGHPVEQRKMRQWMLRITAYADRLIRNLDGLDWPVSLKEMQRNWIGQSHGAEIDFRVHGTDDVVPVYTSRPETIYGVTALVIAPDSQWVDLLVTAAQRGAVDAYLQRVSSRSERERLTEVDAVSGVFTGAHVEHPLTRKRVPVWISDYVIAGYGTGAVMAVPAEDDRDARFAAAFDIEVTPVFERPANDDGNASPTLVDAGHLTGMAVEQARAAIIAHLDACGLGRGKTNYRIRDAIFGRQRYWGEPIPIFYDASGTPRAVAEHELPVVLPEVAEYTPTPDGEPPLARALDWTYRGEFRYESTTMPGWAGSSWYFLRYMDPRNGAEAVNGDKAKYWGAVDLYMGGAEHATGHLLYARFWNLFLNDLGIVHGAEPFAKVVNQGMIQGRSALVYRVRNSNLFVSSGLKTQYDVQALHVDVRFVDEQDNLDTAAFRHWRHDFRNAEFVLENGAFRCERQVEKMSKSKHNVVNPDDVIAMHGADAFRLYEMVLGPIQQSKPWSTEGIEGVARFLRRVWRLCVDEHGNVLVTDEPPTQEESVVLHKTIAKVAADIDALSFNTAVSAFIICVNELTRLDCHKRAILEGMVIALAPFAPFIAEEIWQEILGHRASVQDARYPTVDERFLTEGTVEYPVSIDGKLRTKLVLRRDAQRSDAEHAIATSDELTKWLEQRTVARIVFVPNRIINIVTS